MRVLTLVFAFVLMAALAAPMYGQDYGTNGHPADESPGMTTSPAMEATPEETTAPVETPTESTAPAVEAMPAETGTMSPTTTTAPEAAVTSSQLDSLTVSTVARHYSIDATTLAQLQAKGYTSTDIAALGSLAARTGKPLSEFIDLRSQGMAWPTIAARYNITMSDLATPMAMMVPSEVDAYNRQFVRQYFGLKDSDITSLRNQGMGWGEVYMSANLAARTSKPVTEIASLRSQGLAWNDIGSRYNVALLDLSLPYVPVGRVAGVTAMVGQTVPTPIMGPLHRTVLTQADSERLRAQGYDWQTIAIAANFAVRTGDPIETILSMTDRGMTWRQIGWKYGFSSKSLLEVDSYPFRRDEPRSTFTMQPAGTMTQPDTMRHPSSGGMYQP